MRAMVQFLVGEGEDVEEKLKKLAELGVECDPKFGAIRIAEGKFLVRAEIDEDTQARIDEAGGFQIFGDRKVGPAEDGNGDGEK